MEIIYWLPGAKRPLPPRPRDAVPRVGDEVVLDTSVYLVERVQWLDEEESSRSESLKGYYGVEIYLKKL